MKARRVKKLKTTEKITFICEGDSEFYYLKNLLKDEGLYTDNLEFYNLEGKGYKNCLDYIERNNSILNIVIVILDLDRASKLDSERKTLNRIINKLFKLNNKNNIFLTYPNFENWVSRCINKEVEDLDSLKYEKGNKIYNFIKNLDGSYEKGKKFFCNIGTYYYKDNFKSGSYNKEFINIEHSNLYYLTDYLKLILKR